MISLILDRLQDEVRRVWCYRWLAALVTTLLFCLALVYVLRLPNVYDAWGQLYISKQVSLSAAAEGVSLPGDADGTVRTARRTLLNDQTLERIVRRTDPGSGRLSNQEMALAVKELRSRIQITSDESDGIMEFHVLGADPVRASLIVSLLMNEFISRNLDRSRSEVGRAEAFLDEQIGVYGQLVAQSQAELASLRSRHAGLAIEALPAPATPEPVFSPVAQIAPAAAAPPSPAALAVAALEAKLASLKTTYTEAYPDVVAVRRQLELAKAARDLEPAPAQDQAASGPAVPRQARRAPARRAVTVPPAVAAEWADAQRADEALRIKYQQLIARREAARMSQVIYRSDGSGRFQVTRPPVPPVTPIGPRRGLYLALGALAAIGGGLGAAYLRAAMKGIMVSPRELELACQLPVVGTVSWEAAWATKRGSRPLRMPKFGGGRRDPSSWPRDKRVGSSR